MTPRSAGGIARLNKLIKQDAESIDDTENSKQRLQRHIQKLTKATQVSFAERALLSEQVRFLGKINNKAKTRKMAKGIVIRKARIMNDEDLEKAREERARKTAEKDAKKAKNDARKAAKGAQEARRADFDPTSPLKRKQKTSRKRKRTVEEDEDKGENTLIVTNAVQDSEDRIPEQ